MTRKQEGDDAFPLIVRIAGFPASVMAPFSSSLCAREVAACQGLEEKLSGLRAEMVNCLYSAIPDARPAMRRFLLAVKRDCYNGRSPAKHRFKRQWETIRDLAGPIADQLLDLEEELRGRWAEFGVLYRLERDREHRALLEFLDNRSFLRGVALSSPLLVKSVFRLCSRPTAATHRKERKLELSLLRYISRTAYKLSPHSSLTRIALGTTRIDLEMQKGVKLLGSNWSQRSRVSVKRYILEPCCEMLLRYEPFRANLRIAINNTLEETEPGRYRFMRPEYRIWDDKTKTLKYVPPALVNVSLSGPMVTWLLAALPRKRFTYTELLSALTRELSLDDSRKEIGRVLDRLIEIGAIRYRLPWPGNEVNLESRMLEYLRSLPQDDGLEKVIALLDRIVALEHDYDTVLNPDRSVEEADSLLKELWRQLAILAGFGAEIKRNKVSAKFDLCHDVFLYTPTTDSGDREILQMPHSLALEIVSDIEPWGRLVNLFRHSYDFLHSLGFFMAKEWPGENQVKLLDLFGAVQPLWRDFTRFEIELRERREPGLWRTTFNPFRLEEVETLGHLRESVWKETVEQVRSEAGQSRIRTEDLFRILEKVPKRYTPFVGSCLFLQPADNTGDLWVSNRVFEGTGRYNSRYTTLMDAEMRRRYCAHQKARAVIEHRGERVELLDLMCPQGDGLNIHADVTPHVLELSGEVFGISEERRLTVRDLSVRLSQGGMPQLEDSSGRRYLPVHLGGTNLRFMPTLLKFLAHFGPGEYYNIIPPRNHRNHDDVTIYERLTIGRIVMARKRWVFSPQTLLDQVGRLPDPEAYAAVNQWRKAAGIPERVFLIEKVPDPFLNFVYKPQFLDFTSPLCTSIFCSALAMGESQVTIEEMLPEPDVLPQDTDGTRWAVELQFDTLLLRSCADMAYGEFAENWNVQRNARASSVSAACHPMASSVPENLSQVART